MQTKIKTGKCECGATVVGTGWIVTVEGTELAKCAVCARIVEVA
jgi:ribosome-binding protein aMBF1 (putative translation factor)